MSSNGSTAEVLNALEQQARGVSSDEAQAGASSVCEELATFITVLQRAAVPEAITDRARACLLYGLGIGALCGDEPYAVLTESALASLEGDAGTQGATSWRSGRRLSVSTAAACNTVLMHSRCQEDTAGSAHLGIVVIPTALALIEAGHADGSKLIEALVAGYEAAGALERRLGRLSTARGFRASPLYGTIAGAATAAKLLGLDVAQTAAALANAASFAGGTLQAIGDGTDEWRYQMAGATRRGLEAAFLARVGSRASPAAFDGARGFAAAFAQTEIDEPLNPGAPWVLPNVAFKPYPVCNRNQTATLLAARLHHELDLSQVERIRIRINTFVEQGMLERGPFHSVAGTLMSTCFGCAAALAHGTVSRPMLEAYDDPAIGQWIARLVIEPDEAVAYPSAFAEVVMNNGERLEFAERKTFADYALGRHDVLALLSRLHGESGVDPEILQSLDAFAFADPHRSTTPVLNAFKQARLSRDAARARTP